MVVPGSSLDKVSLPSLLGHIEDWRKGNALRYELNDLIFIAISAVVGGCESYVEIADFYEDHESWFSDYVSLERGEVPSHDTYRRVLMKLKPAYLAKLMKKWLVATLPPYLTQQINIDGKCLRGARNLSRGERALYMVSAWASEIGLTLAMKKVEEKSNEITAIPELLNGLELAGSLVSIDAMGTQKEIAAQIREAKGDYLLALKGNHSNLASDVAELFTRLGPHTMLKSYTHETVDKGHGRISIRKATVIENLLMIRDTEEWKDLRTVVRIEAQTWEKGQKRTETRYYISSLAPDAPRINLAVQNHWQIENAAHWVLDVTFQEDNSTIKKEHGPENMAFLRRIALNLLKIEPSTLSINRKRKKAARNLAFLEKILFG